VFGDTAENRAMTSHHLASADKKGKWLIFTDTS
jgi:hypothetical protein